MTKAILTLSTAVEIVQPQLLATRRGAPAGGTEIPLRHRRATTATRTLQASIANAGPRSPCARHPRSRPSNTRAAIHRSMFAATDPVTPGARMHDAPRLVRSRRYEITATHDGYAACEIGLWGLSPTRAVVSRGRTPAARRGCDGFVDDRLDNDVLVGERAIIDLAVNAIPDATIALRARAGHRLAHLEPDAVIERFDRAGSRASLTAYRSGLNYWLSEHAYNVKVDSAIPYAEQVEG